MDYEIWSFFGTSNLPLDDLDEVVKDVWRSLDEGGDVFVAEYKRYADAKKAIDFHKSKVKPNGEVFGYALITFDDFKDQPETIELSKAILDETDD